MIPSQTNASAKPHSIWGLMLLLVLDSLCFIVVPYLVEAFGLVVIAAHAPIVLGLTLAGLIIKVLCSFLLSENIVWNKTGQEFCVTTMTAVISGLALQLVSDKDLFPGISTTGFWTFLSVFGSSIKNQRLGFLTILLVVTIVFTLGTTVLSMYINRPNTSGKVVLSIFNFIIGCTLFATYITILVLKG